MPQNPNGRGKNKRVQIQMHTEYIVLVVSNSLHHNNNHTTKPYSIIYGVNFGPFGYSTDYQVDQM